jgi:hypothetical protein
LFAGREENMKVFSIFLVLIGICLASCRKETSPKSSNQPAYPINSSEFKNATPPRFHDLINGMTEDAVLKVIGEPMVVNDLWAPGDRSVVGRRHTYILEDDAGVVWIDFDLEMKVTGIFWRDHD